MCVISCTLGCAGLGHTVKAVAASLKLFVEGLKSLPEFVQEKGEHTKLARGEMLVW